MCRRASDRTKNRSEQLISFLEAFWRTSCIWIRFAFWLLILLDANFFQIRQVLHGTSSFHLCVTVLLPLCSDVFCHQSLIHCIWLRQPTTSSLGLPQDPWYVRMNELTSILGIFNILLSRKCPPLHNGLTNFSTVVLSCFLFNFLAFSLFQLFLLSLSKTLYRTAMAMWTVCCVWWMIDRMTEPPPWSMLLIQARQGLL